MTEDVKSSAKPMVFGGLAAVLIGVVVFVMLPQPEPVQTPAIEDTAAVAPVVEPALPVAQAEPEPAPILEATPEEEVAAVPEVAPAPEVVEDAVDQPVETATVEEPETTAPEVSDAPPALVQSATVPAFDTFRVEPDGAMVIAGRADPDQEVAIILAGEMIDRVTADGGGNFVSLAMAGPSPQPRRLSLLADPDGAAIASDTSYIVAPIAAPVVVAADEPAATATNAQDAGEETQTAEATAAESETEQAAAEPPAPEVPLDETVATPPPPPTVLQADADGVRVVQGSSDPGASETEANVALDAITYDTEGEVKLAGRATGDGAVQIYIDNEPVTTSPVEEGGDWQIDLPQIDTGVYTLRIDEVDGEGGVVSRLETPFKREEPADVAAVLAEETAVEGFEVAVRTVQPGSTLWAIAEENLGSGILYVKVFEANKDLIRDPDLIYPGQIFRIPEISQ